MMADGQQQHDQNLSSTEEEEEEALNLLSSQNTFGGKNGELFADIRRVARQQLQHALAEVEVEGGKWELFVRDGELKMYSRELEMEDGIAVDPLKALHVVDGVSAREFIDLFFRPEIKMEWDDIIEQCNVVDAISPHTVVIHQIHRRIWPTARRESLFWSQRLNVYAECNTQDGAVLGAWMVCNQSVERDDVPLSDPSAVRVQLTIAMLCQTVLKSGADATKPREQITRDDIRCKVTYVAQVHPGGWVPKIGLRQLTKREYPKFLRSFSKYVQDKVAGTVLNNPL
uniref:START domain-containing protein n=1 Tax=Globodera rostochiensis TaxID=31243 RepID=A0A914GY77_GLORO